MFAQRKNSNVALRDGVGGLNPEKRASLQPDKRSRGDFPIFASRLIEGFDFEKSNVAEHQTRLDARDELLRRLASDHFPEGMSRRALAMTLESDLRRLRPHHGAPRDLTSKRGCLERAIDLGAQKLGWKQLQNILSGDRTPAKAAAR